jgi:hypothetical protein
MKIKFTHLLATGILLTCSAPLSAGAPYLGVESSGIMFDNDLLFGTQYQYQGRYLIGYPFSKQELWKIGMEAGFTYVPTIYSTIPNVNYRRFAIDTGLSAKLFFAPQWYILGKLGLEYTRVNSYVQKTDHLGDRWIAPVNHQEIHLKTGLGIGYQFANGLALHLLSNHTTEGVGYQDYYGSLGIIYHF